jgi:DNA topoisomerase I
VTLATEMPKGLVWVDDSVPGIRRRRNGSGFTYHGPGRARVDAATRDRIRALAVPPAWTDVWICSDEFGHIQATGRDAKGRKQYRYHARFRAHRDSEKFARLYDFGRVLPAIRQHVADDLARPEIPREKVVATVIRLLEATLVRVGNEEYARANKSYGLTTLRNRHAQFSSAGLRLVFKGKHGIATSVKVQDARLRRVVKRCQDLPGQQLFQYLGDDGAPCPVTSTDVNDYLRAVTGLDVTAKDFRTWMGSLLAAVAFEALPAPESERAARRAVNGVLEEVSSQLGNTPAVCRASYVHPLIIESFQDGSLAAKWEAASARGSRHLLPDERRLLAFLRPPRSRRTSRPRAA